MTTAPRKKFAEPGLVVLIRALMKIVHRTTPPSPMRKARGGGWITVGITSDDGEYCMDDRSRSRNHL